MAYNHRLKQAILDSGYRQNWLAKKAGIEESRLSRVVNGHVEATKEEIRELARALGVTQRAIRG